MDKIFCVLLPNLMVHLAITFKTYKMPSDFWHGGSKIALQPFLASVCFVVMSASKTILERSDHHGVASFFIIEKVNDLPKIYPQAKKKNSSFEKK